MRVRSRGDKRVRAVPGAAFKWGKERFVTVRLWRRLVRTVYAPHSCLPSTRIRLVGTSHDLWTQPKRGTDTRVRNHVSTAECLRAPSRMPLRQTTTSTASARPTTRGQCSPPPTRRPPRETQWASRPRRTARSTSSGGRSTVSPSRTAAARAPASSCTLRFSVGGPDIRAWHVCSCTKNRTAFLAK